MKLGAMKLTLNTVGIMKFTPYCIYLESRNRITKKIKTYDEQRILFIKIGEKAKII